MQLWKWVEGFEGLYEVSNSGIVRSYHKSRKRPQVPHDMAPKIDRRGYQVMMLRKDGTHHMRKVHRMVAQTFVANPHNLPAVNHVDGDKQHNNATNLEWCTNAQNSAHAKVKGLLKQGEPKRGAKNGMAVLTDEQVKFIRENCKPGIEGCSAKTYAVIFNVSPSTIMNIMKRRTWFHI